MHNTGEKVRISCFLLFVRGTEEDFRQIQDHLVRHGSIDNLTIMI